MLQIEINNEFLDLPPDFSVEWRRYSPFFQTEGFIQNDHTLDIPLPNTPHNSRLLGNPEVIENLNRFPPRQSCKIWFDGMPMQSAELRIKSPVNNRVITVNLVSGVSEIGADIRIKSIREIMDEKIIIHSLNFVKEITLRRMSAGSTSYSITINGTNVEATTMEGLVAAINDNNTINVTASIPSADHLHLLPDFGEFTEFFIDFPAATVWRMPNQQPYVVPYLQAFTNFMDLFQGESASNKLRFPIAGNYHDAGQKKLFPIINYRQANAIVQPSLSGVLGGFTGSPVVSNLTSFAAYTTVEYVLERIASYYNITIIAPFTGSNNKMVIDHPNTLDVPIKAIANNEVIFYRRDFNISELVPDMPVNEFLKALQGIGYALDWNVKSRVLEYILRDPIASDPSYTDFSGRHGEIEDIQNNSRVGLTLKHLDNGDKLITDFLAPELNGKKPFVVGSGEKLITSGFSVPSVINHLNAFPQELTFSRQVVTKDQAPSEDFTLSLCFAVDFLGHYMNIAGDFSLGWFGPNGLAATNWKYWIDLENDAPEISLQLFLSELEVFGNIWEKKILIDRTKYLIKSFECSLEEGEVIIVDAKCVKTQYAQR